MSKITEEASRKLPPVAPFYKEEPTPKAQGEGLTSGQLTQALRWYNDNWSYEHMAKTMGVELSLAERFPVYFKVKRLLDRGFVLPHSTKVGLEKVTNDYNTFIEGKEELTTRKMNAPKVDIQAATANKAMTHLAKIEAAFDKALAAAGAPDEETGLRDVKKVDLYEAMVGMDIPGMHIPHIIKQIEADISKKYTAYPKLWKQVIEDLEKLQKNTVVKRAPRKKKVLDASKVVGKLSYLKEDTKLKIVSVNPEKIIKAQELWTYMVDRKYLTHYVAEGPNGLSIKGSTVRGFDAEKSSRRKLRKPEDFLKIVLESRSTKARKELDKLTTKSKEVSGRVSENTLLVKVG